MYVWPPHWVGAGGRAWGACELTLCAPIVGSMCSIQNSPHHSCSLLTLRTPRSSLRVNGEWSFLPVNRLSALIHRVCRPGRARAPLPPPATPRHSPTFFTNYITHITNTHHTHSSTSTACSTVLWRVVIHAWMAGQVCPAINEQWGITGYHTNPCTPEFQS